MCAACLADGVCDGSNCDVGCNCVCCCAADGHEFNTNDCTAACGRCGIAGQATHTPGAPATCTTNQICTVCSFELAPALGHTPGAAATCTTNQICTVCSVQLEPALGHTPGAAATCTTNQICTVCSVQLAPALGHTPGAAATCTVPQTCTACSIELAPALGHNYGPNPDCNVTPCVNGCGTKYPCNHEVNINGGTATPPNGAEGQKVKLTPDDKPGYEFRHWLVLPNTPENQAAITFENGYYWYTILGDGFEIVAIYWEIYPVIQGQNGTWKQGTEAGYTIKVDKGTMAEFVSVKVNGNLLTKDVDYTLAPGSTYVTFTETYLSSLAKGKYNIVVEFEEGLARTTLTIASAGFLDISMDLLLLIIAAITIVTMILVGYAVKNRKKEEQ